MFDAAISFIFEVSFLHDITQLVSTCCKMCKIREKMYNIMYRYYATAYSSISHGCLPLSSSAHFSRASTLLSSLAILAALLPSSLAGEVSPPDRPACRRAGLSSCEVLGTPTVTPVKFSVGTAAESLEADLLAVWGKAAGLSAGVLAADDDPPLSKVSVPRAAKGTEGDAADPEPSASPASGEPRACLFPLLTSAPGSFTCLRRKSRSSARDSAHRSVFPVPGFWGIRLHPCFLVLHRLQGPFGTTTQTWPPSMHQRHCHHLLAPGQLGGRRHT